MDDFGPSFSDADVVVLTDIYPAGEPPIEGITIEALAEAIRSRISVPVHVVKALEELPAAVAGLCRAGDLVITLGAGSIGQVGDRVLAALTANGSPRGGAR
jgi:UDP-N-acetylmuramate--alanine ligase